MNLRLRIPPLVVTVMAGGLAWFLARTSPTSELVLPARTWLALGFVVLGSVCSLLGVASFRRARTTVNPLQLEAATTLVVSGIYGITRNPMYLGFLCLLLGELAWLAHPVAFLAAPGFVLYLNRFQIGPEEQGLRQRFGLEYALYMARVRRWL